MRTEGIYITLKRNSIFILCIMFIGILISGITAFFIIKSSSSYPVVNRCRIITKNASDYIEKNFYAGDFQNLEAFDFKTEIIDSKGNILYNNLNNNKGKINIKENISYDMNFSSLNSSIIKYSCPVVVNDNQVGNAVFFINKESVIKDNLYADIILIFLPSIISFIIIAIKLLINTYEIRKNFITPVVALNKSADAIMRGNFDKKIKYNADTEVGKLCASFEIMRDELKDSVERERKLENSRKELITCISHDLKTPISSIKAYVDGIMDGLAKDHDTLIRYLLVISRKTEILNKLINDLFEHCQAELNELKIQKREIYSGEFLEHISNELSLEFRNALYTFTVSGNMPDVLINVDPSRIEQVIFNLVQNAKKYTPEGGKILFGAELEDGCLKISVKDNGYGVDSMDLPFIFDKFYRGEKARNSDTGGSGLGLSICKYIVEKHSGQIFVESSKGSGSSFYFVIPIT